jgi:hypothetical protein
MGMVSDMKVSFSYLGMENDGKISYLDIDGKMKALPLRPQFACYKMNKDQKLLTEEVEGKSAVFERLLDPGALDVGVVQVVPALRVGGHESQHVT